MHYRKAKDKIMQPNMNATLIVDGCANIYKYLNKNIFS